MELMWLLWLVKPKHNVQLFAKKIASAMTSVGSLIFLGQSDDGTPLLLELSI